MRQEQGFTLVEIAIVLVIIGILLGGVLKGQELITNAKISNLSKSIDEIRAAYNAYQDRFRAYPGDDKKADQHLSTTYLGDGDGKIEGDWNEKSDNKKESRMFWNHLRLAGFLSGDGFGQPSHSFGGIIGVAWQNAFSMGSANTICLASLSGDIAMILDTRLDDGSPGSGGVRAGESGSTTKASSYDDSKTYDVCTKL